MPAVQIRSRKVGPRKKYPVGTAGHQQIIQERRAERGIDVQMNRGIQEIKRQRMGLAPNMPMYNIGQKIITTGGTPGKIIGSAQYITGWEYRIAPDNGKRNIYREEWQFKPAPGAPIVRGPAQARGSVYDSSPRESEKLGSGYGTGKPIFTRGGAFAPDTSEGFSESDIGSGRF